MEKFKNFIKNDIVVKVIFILVVLIALIGSFSDLLAQYDIKTIFSISLLAVGLFELLNLLSNYFDGVSVSLEEGLKNNNVAIALYYGLKALAIAWIISNSILAFVSIIR